MNLKHIFVPTKKNNFHPYAIRWTGLACLLAAITLTNAAYNWQHAHAFRVLGYATSISSYEIVAQTNQQRQANGLASLNTDAQLTQAAQAKAQDMFANNYWAHISPTGTTPWYFMSQAGYAYVTAGENLAKDFDTSSGVITGWMNSPGHRANILNSAYQDVGVAVMNGNLLGADTTLVVAMYGARAAAPAPVAPAPSAPAPQSSPAPVAASSASEPQAEPSAEPAPAADTPPDATATPANEEAKPVATPTAKPATTASTAKDLATLKQVSAKQQLNWAQQVTVFMLCVILLVNVFKHTVVWRTQRRGWRHIWLRAHPVAQYTLIFAALSAMLLSANGVIK